MKTTFFTLLLALISIPAFAQKETPSAETQQEDLIYTVVEEQPEFPGGYDKMMQFLSTNIKYPKKAKKKGIEGRVVVQFVVNKQGELEDIKIVKDIGAGCGEEAVRVIKTMPTWKPGYQGGKVVKVRYNVPIKFIL